MSDTATVPAPGGLDSRYDAWLSEHRPQMVAGFRAALPGARAAVLARLWGALAREPLPGLVSREWRGADLTVIVDGHRVDGPAAAAHPFAVPPEHLAVGGHTDPAALAARLWPQASLAAELDNSVANLALARCAPRDHDTSTPLTGPGALIRAEQTIVDGHPLHPCCRTRLGMTAADVLAYAPEHRPVVPLVLVAVPGQRWHTTGRGLPPVLAVHPWQWRRLQAQHPYLRPTGATLPGRPLMSLRTLAVPGRHVKTAVDVQMTSAVRIVSPAAVHNGPTGSALLAELTAAQPRFAVLREEAAGAVLVDGVPSPSLAMIVRQAPVLRRGEAAVPLAALASAPAGGRPLAVELIGRGYAGAPEPFVADLARLLLPPLLRLLAAGAALEAHGQNVLAVVAGGRLVRLLYRDLGGVRISPTRLRAAGVAPPVLAGALSTDDPEALRSKVFGAAVSTVLAEVVAVLARQYAIAPAALWAQVAAAIPRRGPDAPALFADRLPIKAMTAMRLSPDPLGDLWTTVANPLAGLR